MRLSTLDLSPIARGAHATEALWQTVDLALHCESLGVYRYWFAEHHNAASLGSSSPEVLIGVVGAKTRHLRLGAGGMMLPNHSSLKIAELFRVLSALFPGRIDLGLGRAAGTDPRTARELRRGRPLEEEELAADLDALLHYLGDGALPRAPFAQSTIAIPAGAPRPEIFLLGSSDHSARTAALRGLPFAFAAHMNPTDAEQELTRYRQEFRPSELGMPPYAIVSVAVVCADTDADATELATSAELAGVRFSQGLRDMPLEPPFVAAHFPYDDDQLALREGLRGRMIVGAPDTVAARLRELCARTGANEVMVMTHVFDHDARKRSYTLVAEALGAGG